MNNRIIKFRAWDRIQNKMLSWEILKNQPSNIIAHENSNWEFQQFTGLLDKNDVPIYEGDLVLRKGDGDSDDDTINPIEFFEMGAMFVRRLDARCSIGLNITDMRDFEVIGNIYEKF